MISFALKLQKMVLFQSPLFMHFITEWELVAEKKYCTHQRVGGGYEGLITLASCAESCKDVSPFFAFGREDAKFCVGGLCHCYCQGLNLCGECTPVTASSRDLYRILCKLKDTLLNDEPLCVTYVMCKFVLLFIKHGQL